MVKYEEPYPVIQKIIDGGFFMVAYLLFCLLIGPSYLLNAERLKKKIFGYDFNRDG
jgi:hypothetical protein